MLILSDITLVGEKSGRRDPRMSAEGRYDNEQDIDCVWKDYCTDKAAALVEEKHGRLATSREPKPIKPQMILRQLANNSNILSIIDIYFPIGGTDYSKVGNLNMVNAEDYYKELTTECLLDPQNIINMAPNLQHFIIPNSQITKNFISDYPEYNGIGALFTRKRYWDFRCNAEHTAPAKRTFGWQDEIDERVRFLCDRITLEPGFENKDWK